MNYRNVKIEKGWHFWVTFQGKTIIGDRLYAIIQNEQVRKGYLLNKKEEGDFRFEVQLKPGTYTVLCAYFTPHKCLDKWVTQLKVDGRIHTSNNMEVLLEGEAKDIPDARLMQLTRQFKEWEPLIHYSDVVDIWEKSNSACAGTKGTPISFPCSDFESEEEIRCSIDHEAAHRYADSPEFLKPHLIQLIRESLKVGNYHPLKQNRNFYENSLIMLFKESTYIPDTEESWSSGHPWDNVGELFASTTTILRNRPQEFISNLQQSKNPELVRTIAREVLTAYMSNN